MFAKQMFAQFGTGFRVMNLKPRLASGNVGQLTLIQRLMWMRCPGHAGVKGTDRADRLVGKANTKVACV